MPCWVEEVRRRKFRWAGHVARREDGRWTKAVLDWVPNGLRRRGRPVQRWVDSIQSFFRALLGEQATDRDWMAFASERDAWKRLEDDYASRNWIDLRHVDAARAATVEPLSSGTCSARGTLPSSTFVRRSFVRGYTCLEIHSWISMHGYPCMDIQSCISMHGYPCCRPATF